MARILALAFVLPLVQATPTPAPIPAAVNGECDDVDAPRLGGNCFNNVTWALETGLEDFPDYYVNYTRYSLSPATSRYDMQCVLYHMREVYGVTPAESAGGHHCPIPCNTNLTDLCPAPTPVPTPATTLAATILVTPAPAPVTSLPTPTPTEPEEDASLSWWMICLLIALAVLTCAGLCLVLTMHRKPAKAAAPKKRALRKVTPPAPLPPPPAPAPMPQPRQVMTYIQQPVHTTAIPVPTAQPLQTTYAAPQALMQMQPVQTTYAPPSLATTYAAPPAQMTYAAPAPQQVQYAQPVQTMQQPVQQYAQPVQQMQTMTQMQPNYQQQPQTPGFY